MGKELKKLVILHSNDLHADFLSTKKGNTREGGMALLAGYVNKVRQEEENVIYAVSGDMFNGSVMDSEFLGLTTLIIMNYIHPDVVCVGNHELDYGLTHTLFIEKSASFPIVNSNLYIHYIAKPLYSPYKIIEKGGLRIFFTGIITEIIAQNLKQDATVGEYIDIIDPKTAVRNILDETKDQDIDLRILLTHIGIEEDKKLAAQLGENTDIDAIIGGHSHTILKQPEVVNDIIITQAGIGTHQIGRFDIYYDEDTKEIDHFNWCTIPLNSETCPEDEEIFKYIEELKQETDKKYKRIICTFDRIIENKERNRQTEVGNFMSDVLKTALDVDIFLLSSGTFRKKQLGPEVTFEDFMQLYPYSSPVYKLLVTGKQLKDMLLYAYNKVDLNNPKSSEPQLSEGFKIVYDTKNKTFDSFLFNGKEVDDEKIFSLGIGKFMYIGFENYFGIPIEEIEANSKPVIISNSDKETILNYFEDHKDFMVTRPTRLTLINSD